MYQSKLNIYILSIITIIVIIMIQLITKPRMEIISVNMLVH